MTKYIIKPLKWSKSKYILDPMISSTPFGSYHVRRIIEPGENGKQYYMWGYCFTEYTDEKEFICSTLESGKALANRDWHKRIKAALKKVK